MKAKTLKPGNIIELLSLVKTIFDCNYEAEIFVQKNLKAISGFALAPLYPITFLLKNPSPDTNFNSPKNVPILYFPAAKKINATLETEKHRFMQAVFIRFKTKLIFSRPPSSSTTGRIKIPALIGGELSIDCDYQPPSKIKNTFLNIFTVFELLLAVKDKALQAQLIAALNPSLQEKFNVFLASPREQIGAFAKISKKVYQEHFDFFEGTTKIKNFYQHKTLLSIKKGRSKILFDGYCTDAAMTKALKKTLADLLIFYRVFFTDIILN